MTYVSRRTRIIVSSWLDECDAEYRLRASRRRSDGRLKKYSSCDDFRAWVNDNCIKHEYLAELMSNGAFPDRSPFRLYGRFIPVPVLFQLTQASKTIEANQSTDVQDGKQGVQDQEGNLNVNQSANQSANQNANQNADLNAIESANQNAGARRSKSETAGKQGDAGDEFDEDMCVEDDDESKLSCGSMEDVAKVDSNSSLIRTQWEKSVLEKSLLQCTCLLNKAMTKLENIDCIVALVNEEHENVRTEEIQGAFYKSKLSCSCSAVSTAYNTLPSSRSCLKKLKESAKCTELLRKISGLREKLKKIQECRREINHQIQSSKRRFECASSLQLTELYSRQEQANIKKLQKKLEKLIGERGRLLSEMCQALTSLNNIKRSSKSTMNFRKRNSKSFAPDFTCQSPDCDCSCKHSENSPDSEDSTRFRCYESSSSDSDDNNRQSLSRHSQRTYSFDFQCDEANNYENADSDFDTGYGNRYEYGKSTRRNSNVDPSSRKQNQQLASSREANAENAKADWTQGESTKKNGTKGNGTKENNTKGNGTEESGAKESGAKTEGTNTEDGKDKCKDGKGSKKSRVQFVCPESPCRKKLDADDLSAFENTLTQEQLCIISEALQSIQQSRPNTSPTTKRERQSVSLDKDGLPQNRTRDTTNKRQSPGTGALDRRVKSETTMKDIEKTLRNYQRRLSDMENIENKVEEMREKISEGHMLRKNLAKMKAEKRQSDADREKSEREITRLCSENWELKRQVQDLTAKFSAQSKKIQNLKCGAMRARELECQAEELKKELSEYREGFEHQRKCISKWESVVAVQRTEIENLMNHIRMLTTAKAEEASSGLQEKRCAQRSRSYSPELIKGRKTTGRQRTQTRTFAPPSDEETGCCCDSYVQLNNRRISQPRSFDRSYYPAEKQWCN